MFDGKSVLITGGTGTLGQVLAYQFLNRWNLDRLIIFSRDEYKQHKMMSEYSDSYPIRFIIGDVRDKDRVDQAMNNVDVVIHAAAMKQVPICEYNPYEAIRTNIEGTKNVIDAAIRNDVGRLLYVSTDKAVGPVNLYGATKLCAESLVVQGNFYPGEQKTIMSCIRPGNMIDSRGAALELFLEQKKTGNITLTDPEMTRFFMKSEELSKFVMDILIYMTGGEIFIPKMKSARIRELIDVIAPDCAVRIIGKRPGEKVHEQLLNEEEIDRTVIGCQGKAYVILPNHHRFDTTTYAGFAPVTSPVCSKDNPAGYLDIIEMLKGF